jgi:ERCC4-related helicase
MAKKLKKSGNPTYSQSVLDFGPHVLPVLNLQQQKDKIRSFLEANNIVDFFKLETIGLRPPQFVLMERSCKLWGENFLIEAGTGIGKTLLYFVLAAKCMKEGKIPILVTFEGKQVNQAVKKSKKQMRLLDEKGQESEYLTIGLSEETPPDEREALLKISDPSQVITTSGVMITDFEHYDWEKVGFIMFDETQNMVGDSSMMMLAKMIKEKCASLKNPPIVCGMSATLASTKENLICIQNVLDAKRIITVRNPNDLKEDPEEQVKLVPVDLDPLTKSILHHLNARIAIIANELKTAVEAAVLFINPQKVDYWLPSFKQRQLLWKKLYKKGFDHPKISQLRDDLFALEFYCDLHSRILSLGHFAILEKYCYTRVQWLALEENVRVDLPEMKSPPKSKKEDKKDVSFEDLSEKSIFVDLREEPIEDAYEKPKQVQPLIRRGVVKVLEDKELHKLLLTSAKKSPYENVLNATSWIELREKLKDMDFSETFGEFSTNAKRRFEKTAIKNKYFLSRAARESSEILEMAEDIARVRCFFDHALGFMAKRELNDHQKEIDLLKQLSQVRNQIAHVSSFIFTSHTRHAEFLAERIESSTQTPDLRSVAAHGRRGAGMKAWRKSAFEGFNSKKFNVLVTTVAFAGTGIDVENATIGVHYALANSNHVLLVQANGRVLGRADDPLLYLLWSKGAMSTEMKRFYAAVNKEVRRRKIILRRADIVEIDFEVEKFVLAA